MRRMHCTTFSGIGLVLIMAAGILLPAGVAYPAADDPCAQVDNATTPQPAYTDVSSFEVVFGRNSDLADIYCPTGLENTTRLPMALLLQGGRCDKQYYSMFATHVARYGFIVAVPNHYHKFKLGPIDTDGLFSEGTQMQDYIDYMKQQNDNSSSPFYQKVDTGKLMMLGHSYGAACVIYTLQNNCMYPFCPEDYAFELPKEVKAAALCGINSKPRGKPFDYKIYPTKNNGIPLAFVNGSRDNNAKPWVTFISYRRIQDPPKMLVFIKGANHYASLDINNPPAPAPDGSLGHGPGKDPHTPTLSQEVSSEIAARWCALFLRAYGLDDPVAKLYVEQNGACLDTQVRVFIEPAKQ